MKKFKIIFFFIFSTFFFFAFNSEAFVNFDWVKQIGSENYQEGKSVAIDSLGNSHLTGYFYGTVDFDPGLGIYQMSSFGTSDIFVSKFDSEGNFLWAKQLGGPDYDQGLSLAVDSNGNVYTIGFFNGMADFDPSLGIYNAISNGNSDIFISKLDSDGNFVWVKQFGGASEDLGNSIAIGQDDEIYFTGSFKNSIEADFGDYSITLISAGGKDIFIGKISSSGDLLLAEGLGGTGDDQGLSIKADKNTDGDFIFAGYFSDTVDFDPSDSEFILSSFGDTDIFIEKMDSFGNLIFAKQKGGIGEERALALSVDSNDNIYTTGYFGGVADFNPNANHFFIVSSGPADVFIDKTNSSGDFVWVKNFGGEADDYGNSLVADLEEEIYLTGNFRGTADFNPGKKTSNISSFGQSDIFVSKFDSEGNFLWAKQMGGANFDSGNSICLGTEKEIYITGYFKDTADFDPGPGIFDLTSFGGYDAFLEKIKEEVFPYEFCSTTTTASVAVFNAKCF